MGPGPTGPRRGGRANGKRFQSVGLVRHVVHAILSVQAHGGNLGVDSTTFTQHLADACRVVEAVHADAEVGQAEADDRHNGYPRLEVDGHVGENPEHGPSSCRRNQQRYRRSENRPAPGAHEIDPGSDGVASHPSIHTSQYGRERGHHDEADRVERVGEGA